MSGSPLKFDLYSFSIPRLGRHPDDAASDCQVLVERISAELKKDQGVNFILGVAIGSTSPEDKSITFQTGWSHAFADDDARLATIGALLPSLRLLPWRTRIKLGWAIMTGRQIADIRELQSREERRK